jgi:hypothetical protein
MVNPYRVPQQPQSMFTTTGSATSSPLLNYGQSEIRKSRWNTFNNE